jgi:hypothetical protein
VPIYIGQNSNASTNSNHGNIASSLTIAGMFWSLDVVVLGTRTVASLWSNGLQLGTPWDNLLSLTSKALTDEVYRSSKNFLVTVEVVVGVDGGHLML